MNEWDDQTVVLLQEVNEIRLAIGKADREFHRRGSVRDVWIDLIREQLTELPQTVEDVQDSVFVKVNEKHPQHIVLRTLLQEMADQVDELVHYIHRKDKDMFKMQVLRLLGDTWALRMLCLEISKDFSKNKAHNREISEIPQMQYIVEDASDEKDDVTLELDGEEQQDDAMLVIQRPVKKE